MATFYIQLENKLLQISGELTAENISKALGYVPVSPNVTNELSQRVDNITFDSLKDNPFLQDGSGELNIVDEAGNIITKIDADGIHSFDFIAGEHRLSDKTDKTYVDEAIKNVEVDLTGYATEEYVNNIDFYNIKDNPIANGEENSLTLVDENGNIGLKVSEDGLYVKDVIADGHTLSQKADKSELPTKVSDLTNDSGYITINDVPEVTVPTKVSDLENDKGYITATDIPEVEIPSLDEYVKSEDLPNFDEFAKTENIPSLDGYAKTSDIPSLDGYATEEWVNNKNYATEYDLKNIDYSSINNVPVSEDETGELNITDENGNIGMKVASEAVYAKDFVAGEHKLSEKVDKTYVDNSIAELVDGAPETLDTLNELAAALNDNADIVDVLNQSINNKQDAITDLETIRQGAAKGATALQSYTEQYKGTVTGVKINGSSKGTSGVVDLGNVVTSVKINGSTKTPTNGVVDLGTISGGGGNSSGGNGAYSEVNHGTSDTTFTLTPNTFHIWDEVANLTLTLGSETSGVANEFLFQFNSGSEATTLSLPSDLKWANDSAPAIVENMIYQVSVLKGLASVLEFSNAVEKVNNLIEGKVGGNTITALFPVASDITIEYWDEFADDIYTVVMPVGTSEVTITERFGYIENLSPKEDDNFYYLY